MRRTFIAVIAALLAVTALAGCSKSTPPNMSQEATNQMASELLTTTMDALRDGNTETLKAVLAPSFQIVRSDGTYLTYQQLIDEVGDPSKYDLISYQLGDMNAIRDGNYMSVRFTATLELTSAGKKYPPTPTLFLSTFVQQHGSWLQTSQANMGPVTK